MLGEQGLREDADFRMLGLGTNFIHGPACKLHAALSAFKSCRHAYQWKVFLNLLYQQTVAQHKEQTNSQHRNEMAFRRQ